jgi:hypothetical protein
VHVFEHAFHPEAKLPHIPRAWINRSLYMISRAEQKILSKLPIPIGSSLMAVVERQ